MNFPFSLSEAILASIFKVTSKHLMKHSYSKEGVFFKEIADVFIYFAIIRSVVFLFYSFSDFNKSYPVEKAISENADLSIDHKIKLLELLHGDKVTIDSVDNILKSVKKKEK